MIKLDKKLVQNFGYLTIDQIVNLALPLVTYYYLINLLGKTYYGKAILAVVIVEYFAVLVNFGFNLSGVQSISKNREDTNKIRKILSGIYYVKFLLMLVSAIAYFLIVYFAFRENFELYAYTFTICIGAFLNMLFFFQGMEDMKYITIINTIIRVLFTVLIFFSITEIEHYIYVPLFNGLGQIVAGLISLFVLFKWFDFRFVKQTYIELVTIFNEGLVYFSTRIAAVLNEKSVRLLIGIVLGDEQIAVYDLAEKIIKPLKSPFMILSQTIYPRVAQNNDFSVLRKTITLTVLIALVMIAVLWFVAPWIILTIANESLMEAKYIIYILSVTLLFDGVSYQLGAPGLLVLGKVKIFNAGIIAKVALLFILCLVLYLSAGIESIMYFAVIAAVISLFDMVYRLYYSRKFKII
ncbi:MAG: oligosaccharide flippase family protein [Nonlabens sp.]|uniref:oligosaccharide flippase family protein n=1 Tax=Nonlabens sp. TaxID=1888209 RepID=UPI003EF0DA43